MGLEVISRGCQCGEMWEDEAKGVAEGRGPREKGGRVEERDLVKLTGRRDQLKGPYNA